MKVFSLRGKVFLIRGLAHIGPTGQILKVFLYKGYFAQKVFLIRGFGATTRPARPLINKTPSPGPGFGKGFFFKGETFFNKGPGLGAILARIAKVFLVKGYFGPGKGFYLRVLTVLVDPFLTKHY